MKKQEMKKQATLNQGNGQGKFQEDYRARSDVHTVFVYGSLMRGMGNHHIMDKARGVFLGEGETLHKYWMMSLGYFPAVDTFEAEESGSWIKGEIYQVPEGGLFLLDELEGHPNFYKRKMIRLKGGGFAWMYFLEGCRGEGVPDGDWRLFVESGEKERIRKKSLKSKQEKERKERSFLRVSKRERRFEEVVR